MCRSTVARIATTVTSVTIFVIVSVIVIVIPIIAFGTNTSKRIVITKGVTTSGIGLVGRIIRIITQIRVTKA